MALNTILAEKPLIHEKHDSGFLVAMLLLLGLGLITLYISSTGVGLRIKDDRLHFVKRQLIYILIGIAFMFTVTFIKTEIIKKFLPFIVFGALFFCFLTFIPGLAIKLKGAQRWIKLPFFGRFQPSEFVKPAIVLFLANLFSKDYKDGTLPDVIKASIVLFLFVFVIFLQDDFSTGFFIMMVGILMLFVAGVKLHWFFSFCVISLPIAFLFIFTKEYRVNRLIAFFNTSADMHGLNYQVNSARKAISAGGFWGEGITSSLRSVYTIPEIQADFVFAGWAESMGFIGVLLYFSLLVYFAIKGYQVAINCQNKFNALASFGLITCLILQSLINCGVVCGALPSTGIPMPFFSSGGSSMVVTLLMCGLILNFFRSDKKIKLELMYE